MSPFFQFTSFLLISLLFGAGTFGKLNAETSSIVSEGLESKVFGIWLEQCTSPNGGVDTGKWVFRSEITHPDAPLERNKFQLYSLNDNPTVFLLTQDSRYQCEIITESGVFAEYMDLARETFGEENILERSKENGGEIFYFLKRFSEPYHGKSESVCLKYSEGLMFLKLAEQNCIQ